MTTPDGTVASPAPGPGPDAGVGADTQDTGSAGKGRFGARGTVCGLGNASEGEGTAGKGSAGARGAAPVIGAGATMGAAALAGTGGNGMLGGRKGTRDVVASGMAAGAGTGTGAAGTAGKDIFGGRGPDRLGDERAGVAGESLCAAQYMRETGGAVHAATTHLRVGPDADDEVAMRGGAEGAAIKAEATGGPVVRG